MTKDKAPLLTLKALKERLKSLEDDGIANDSTIICKFDDVHCSFAPLTSNCKLVVDVNACIKRKEDDASFYEMSYPNKANEIRREIEMLHSFGDTAICLA